MYPYLTKVKPYSCNLIPFQDEGKHVTIAMTKISMSRTDLTEPFSSSWLNTTYRRILFKRL